MTQQALGPGSVVASRFRLEDLLEERAGARFWRATDLTLARNVAIHLVPADDPRAEAVLTAARTSATVNEPHLLRVLDALEENGVVHVVHEWGSGVSLDRMLAEETLDARRAAWLVREVATTITATHAQGVAHGRLLPENVLVTDSGAVKLIGFVVDAVLYGPLSPAYSPDTRASEHENDVRNLGALLYAGLVGRWPGLPPSVVPEAPLDHDRVCRPRQVRAGVPRELDALCDRLLNDLHADDEPLHTAASVASALGHFLGDESPSALSSLSATTAFLAPDALTTQTTPGADVDESAQDDAEGFTGNGAAGAGTDPEATQASPLADPRAADDDTGTGAAYDPEATQASGFGAVRPSAPRPAPSAGPEPESATTPVGTPGHLSDPSLERRPAPRPASPRAPGLGMGAGEVPPGWGPDYEDTGALPVYEAPKEAPGSIWLRLGAVLGVVLLLGIAAVVVANLGGPDLVPGGSPGNDTASSSEPAAKPKAVKIAAADDFDPEQDGGTPEENPDLVPLILDGDPSTAWRTSRYNDGPVLAPYKNGVGVLLDLGEQVPVADVTLTLPGKGYTVELLSAGEADQAPTSTDGLDQIGSAEDAGGEVTLTPDDAVTTRFLVVWLTALPSVPGGYQGQIAEVVVRS